jgi:hypothetical protein
MFLMTVCVTKVTTLQISSQQSQKYFQSDANEEIYDEKLSAEQQKFK